jgi:hypothetical protein
LGDIMYTIAKTTYGLQHHDPGAYCYRISI